jgi:hypothetical protein
MSKVPPFHTDHPEYPPSHRNVYHDNGRCGYGAEIVRNGHAVPGDDGRPRCDECEHLAAEGL